LPCGAELRALGCTAQELAGRGFRRGRGCGRCDETGYDGRLGLFELLLLDEAGREHLRTFEGAAALRRSAALSGPATLLEDGLVKAARGLTTLEELVRVVPRVARPRPLAELERLLGEQR
jgi:type IV pilus assembly protein PilB